MLRRSFLLWPFASFYVGAQDPRRDAFVREQAQRLLKGLTRVGFSIDVLGDAASLVDQNRLQTRFELRLRQLGVPVASGSIAPDPTLTLTAYTLRVSPESISLTLSAVLVEMVNVPRLAGFAHLGRTWGGNPMLTTTKPASAAADIEDAFNELLEMFANDYLAANPGARR